MIKKKDKWSISEWQVYGKGFLEGLGTGIFLSFNIGCMIYLYYKSIS